MEAKQKTQSISSETLLISELINGVDGQDYYISKPIKIFMDPAKTHEQLIVEGNYNFVHESVSSRNFPQKNILIRENVMLMIRLFLFQNETSSLEAEMIIKSNGCQSANLDTLILFGNKYPNMQRNFLLTALGSVWFETDYRYCPILKSINGQRQIDLMWFDGGWLAKTVFIGIMNLKKEFLLN